jgi:hypothetical protein
MKHEELGKTGTGALWVSNEEIAEKMPIRPGDTILCPQCEAYHKVSSATGPDGEKSLALQYVKHKDGSLQMVGANEKYIGDLPIEKLGQ